MRMVLSVFPGGGHHRKEDGGSVRALAGVLQGFLLGGAGIFHWEVAAPRGGLARSPSDAPTAHGACRSWRWDELLASTGGLRGGKQSKRPAGGP